MPDRHLRPARASSAACAPPASSTSAITWAPSPTGSSSRTQPIRCYFFIADCARPHHRLRRPLDIAPNTTTSSSITSPPASIPQSPCSSSRATSCSTANCPCSRHDHSARLARARPQLQRDAGEPHRQGPHHLRLPRLPGPHGVRHPALPAAIRSRRPGSAGARRAHPRNRPPLQQFLQSSASRSR